jgi:murein DD-endopeptidase MepM/ murein hydrolase activator NlpD
MLGTRYAYDFIQVNWDKKGWPAYKGSLLKYLIFGIPIRDYYCWGQEICAPCNGVVVRAEDGWKERERTSLFKDFAGAYRAAHHFDPKTGDVRSVAGNFVVIKARENVYAALCHLQAGSVQVAVGQTIKQGDRIGNVGHSGNSFGPHLHFQLMDSVDMETANGLPCAFEHYEVCREGKWIAAANGIPTNKDRIRVLGVS